VTDDLIQGLPSVGDPAPELALPDDSGTIQNLAAQRGRWVVLFFYPKDFTAGCSTEACDFRDRGAAFRDAGAVVWGISILDSASKAGFKAQHALDYPLLADEDHAAAERYGVWVEKTSYGKRTFGIQRATLLVDPEGRIANVWPRVTVEGHAAEVLETLRTAAAAL
jgi:thioredoxin-dependent peroxiredoxin